MFESLEQAVTFVHVATFLTVWSLAGLAAMYCVLNKHRVAYWSNEREAITFWVTLALSGPIVWYILVMVLFFELADKLSDRW